MDTDTAHMEASPGPDAVGKKPVSPCDSVYTVLGCDVMGRVDIFAWQCIR